MNTTQILSTLQNIPAHYKLYVSQLSCLKGYKCDEITYNNCAAFICSSEFNVKHLTVGEAYNILNRINRSNILCNENGSKNFSIEQFVVYQEKEICVCVAL
jgi:hypothetical protein